MEALKTFQSFLNFCYVVCRPSLDEDTLQEVKDHLKAFHVHRVL